MHFSSRSAAIATAQQYAFFFLTKKQPNRSVIDDDKAAFIRSKLVLLTVTKARSRTISSTGSVDAIVISGDVQRSAVNGDGLTLHAFIAIWNQNRSRSNHRGSIRMDAVVPSANGPLTAGDGRIPAAMNSIIGGIQRKHAAVDRQRTVRLDALAAFRIRSGIRRVRGCLGRGKLFEATRALHTAPSAHRHTGAATSGGQDIAAAVNLQITAGADGVSLGVNVKAAVHNVLMDNAVKYSPEGGCIAVRLEQESRSLKFSVSNTTVHPVEKDQLNRLFDRFYRMDQSRNSSTDGYGLGMSIARSIVAVHKGKIRAECPGENVLVISVTLPL